MNKTFRGLLADGGSERIRLSTNNGLTGYRVKKFQGIQNTPGTGQSVEAVMKIHTIDTTENGTIAVDNVVDFRSPTLIAVVYYQDNNGTAELSSETIIFDSMVFNQDIFITHIDSDGAVPMNYYLELEQVKLSGNEATVATLKDMRAGPDTNFGP